MNSGSGMLVMQMQIRESKIETSCYVKSCDAPAMKAELDSGSLEVLTIGDQEKRCVVFRMPNGFTRRAAAYRSSILRRCGLGFGSTSATKPFHDQKNREKNKETLKFER